MFFMFLATRQGGTDPFIKAVDGSGSFEDPAFIYAGNKIQDATLLLPDRVFID